MYSFQITNNYAYEIDIANIKVAANGGVANIPEMGGNVLSKINGMGDFLILDLGEYKIPGYNLEQTWGLLFRYKSTEIYARYEGVGTFELIIDRLGDVTLKVTNGDALHIKLEDLYLEGNEDSKN